MVEGTFKPLVSWDGKENLQGIARTSLLEQTLQDRAAVFDSIQASIMACLESLGSRKQQTAVIMPVTAPLDALMGVIRAGAMPVLLDVSAVDLQLDRALLREALEALENAVVYLNIPGGLPVAPELVEALAAVPTCPTIVDTRLPPVYMHFHGSYTIYDLSTLVGAGAVMLPRDPEQLDTLKILRNEAVAELPEVCAALAYKRLDNIQDIQDTSEYADLLETSSKSGIIGFRSAYPTPVFLAMVEDGKAVLSHIQSKNYQGAWGAVPLYFYPHVRERWQEEPEYPVAEKLAKEVILLPNHCGIDRTELLEEIYGKCKENQDGRAEEGEAPDEGGDSSL